MEQALQHLFGTRQRNDVKGNLMTTNTWRICLALVLAGCAENGSVEQPGQGKADELLGESTLERVGLLAPGDPGCEGENLTWIETNVTVPATLSESGEEETFPMFGVCHDNELRIPRWVAEEVTPSMIGGPAQRNDRFRPEASLAPEQRASLDDYRGIGRKGYHRGHMAPAANYRVTQLGAVEAPTLIDSEGNDVSSRGERVCDRDDEVAFDDVACATWLDFVLTAEGEAFDQVASEMLENTFFLSNMAPQAPDLNSQVWRFLEEDIRDHVATGSKAWIYTGNLFLESPEGMRYAPVAHADDWPTVDPVAPPSVEGEDEPNWAEYRWISAAVEETDDGDIPSWRAPNSAIVDDREVGRVAVPTHCYKLVVFLSPEGERSAYAFVLPNPDPWGEEDTRRLVLRDPEDYQVTVDQLEEFLNVDLMEVAAIAEDTRSAWPPTE